MNDDSKLANVMISRLANVVDLSARATGNPQLTTLKEE